MSFDVTIWPCRNGAGFDCLATSAWCRDEAHCALVARTRDKGQRDKGTSAPRQLPWPPMSTLQNTDEEMKRCGKRRQASGCASAMKQIYKPLRKQLPAQWIDHSIR